MCVCSSILVSDYLPQATTQALYFEWSLTRGSTVIDNLDSGKKTIGLELCLEKS